MDFPDSLCYLIIKDLDEKRKSLYEMTKNIYTSPNLHDIVLGTKHGQILYSHKTILYSISEYFKNFFDKASTELEKAYCKLPDFVNYEQLRILLNFVYTGECCIQKSDVRGLYALAVFLQYDRLVFLMEEQCSQHIPDIKLNSVADAPSIIGSSSDSDPVNKEVVGDLQGELKQECLIPQQQQQQPEPEPSDKTRFLNDVSANSKSADITPLSNKYSSYTFFFECLHCNLSFSFWDDWNKHFIATHANSPNLEIDHAETGAKHYYRRIYSCTNCNKRYTSSSAVKIHYRNHTGEQPFECEFCNRKFTSSGNLKRHFNYCKNV
ncbi:zinc finger protein 131-like [Aphidius gifuensis]|uniref:zinc finger protein 131-like n=1 Tax=Aphidius gifuensis TaxID=684658 RepID=UPI001CDC3DDB|nr:zinc finger protein 131-like [Aphidius gifuensis]